MNAQQFEHQTFIDLLELLEAKYVIQPGTRDKENNTLFILSDIDSRTGYCCEPQSVLAALNYLVSSWIRYTNYSRDDELGNNNDREIRIALLIDRRNATWQQVEALASAINSLIEGSSDTSHESGTAASRSDWIDWRSMLRRIYVLKSAGFTSLFAVSNTQKTLAKQSRVPLVFANSLTQLNTFVSLDALPAGAPFNGSCAYDHDSWLKQRNAVESYVQTASNLERKAVSLEQRWRAERHRIQHSAPQSPSRNASASLAPEETETEAEGSATLLNVSEESACEFSYRSVAECTQAVSDEEKRAYATLISIEQFLEDVESLIDHCSTVAQSAVANQPQNSARQNQAAMNNENEKENDDEFESGACSNASTLKDGTLRIDATGSLHVGVLERVRRQLTTAYTRYRRAWNIHCNVLRRVLEFRRFEERAAQVELELESRMVGAIETARRNALETTRLDELETILCELIALQTEETNQGCMKRFSELLLFAMDRNTGHTESEIALEMDTPIDEEEPLAEFDFDWDSRLCRLRQVGYRLQTLLENCESCLRSKQRVLDAVAHLESWCTRCDTLLEAIALAEHGQQSQLSEADAQQLVAFASEYDPLVAPFGTNLTDDADDGFTPQLTERVQLLVSDAAARMEQLRAAQARLEQAAREREEAQRVAEQAEREAQAEIRQQPEPALASSRLSEAIATLRRKAVRRSSEELLRRPTDDIVLGSPKSLRDGSSERVLLTANANERCSTPQPALNATAAGVGVPDLDVVAGNAASFENGFSTLKRLREIQQLELAVSNVDEPMGNDNGSPTVPLSQSQMLMPPAANGNGSNSSVYASGTLKSVAPGAGVRHSPSVAVKDKHFLRCRYVVNELIETERAYVNDLETVVRGYADAWRSDTSLEQLLPAAFRSEPDTHFATLFGNMPAILAFHKQCVLVHLLSATQPATASNTLVRGAEYEPSSSELELCDVFIANEARFVELYASYCQGRSAADRLLRAANRGEFDVPPDQTPCAACERERERERANAEPVVNSRAERKVSSTRRPDEAALDAASRADSLKRAAEAAALAAQQTNMNVSRSSMTECKCQSPVSASPPPSGDTLNEHAYFRECRKRLRHRLPLDAYLLKPTQRITKYQLLLTDLLRSMKAFQAASLGAEADDAVRSARLARFCGRVERVELAQRTMLRVLASINNAMHEAMIVACPKRNFDAFGPLLLQASCTVFYKLAPPRSNTATNQERASIQELAAAAAPPSGEQCDQLDSVVDMRKKRLPSSTSAQSISSYAAATASASGPSGTVGSTNAISASLKQHYYSQRTHHRHLFLYERCILFSKPMNVDDTLSNPQESSSDPLGSAVTANGSYRSSVLRGDVLNGSMRAPGTAVGLPIGSRQVRYRIKHILELNRVGLTESLPGNPRRFELWTPREREKYIIEMKKADEKTTWTEAIKTLLFKQLQEIKQRRSSVAIGVHYIDLPAGAGGVDQLHTVNSYTLHANAAPFKFAHPDSPDSSSKAQSATRHARRSSLTMLREQSLPNPNVNAARQSSKTGFKVAGKAFKKQIAKIGQKFGSNSYSRKSAARLSVSNQVASVASQPLAELPSRNETESTTESEFEADMNQLNAPPRGTLNHSTHSADNSVVSSTTVASTNTFASSSSSVSSNRSPSASVNQTDAVTVVSSASGPGCCAVQLRPQRSASPTGDHATHCSTSSLTEADALGLASGSTERSDDVNSVSTRSVGSADSAVSSVHGMGNGHQLLGPMLDSASADVHTPRMDEENAVCSTIDNTVCVGTPSLVRFDASTLRRTKQSALYVALSDYIAVTDRELTTYEGDLLQAARKRSRTTTRSPDHECETGTDSDHDEPIYVEPRYIYVRKLATDKFGYVPASYLTRHEPLADTTLNESIL